MKRRQTARMMTTPPAPKSQRQRRQEALKEAEREAVRVFEVKNPVVSPVFRVYRRAGDVNMEKSLVDFAVEHDLGVGQASASLESVGNWLKGL